MKKIDLPAFSEFMLAEATKYGRAMATAEIETWFETFGRSTLEDFQAAWQKRAESDEGSKWFPKIPELQALLRKGEQRRKQSDWRCAEEVGGQRCNYPGAISLGTLGFGPWYCSAHFKLKGSSSWSEERSQRIVEHSQSFKRPTNIDEIFALSDRRREAARSAREATLRKNAERAHELAPPKEESPRPEESQAEEATA